MLKILVVDDEKNTRDKMIKSINHAENGITIIGKASDGLEAIRLIRELLPDIVLIDIEMPGMSGLDVIKIARNENLPTVFIVISAYDKFVYARDCIRLEVNDFLLKPFYLCIFAMPCIVHLGIFQQLSLSHFYMQNQQLQFLIHLRENHYLKVNLCPLGIPMT